MRILILALTALVCGNALAEETSFKPGFHYRASLQNDNDKWNDNSAGDNAAAKTNIALNFARLTGVGQIHEKVTYKLWYNLKNGNVQIATATLKLSEMLEFSIGRHKTSQGGFEFRMFGADTILGTNSYTSYMPLPNWSDAIGIHANFMGKFSLFIADDPMAASTAGIAASGTKNSSKKSTSSILQWMGAFGDIKPLVQFGSYDLNNSKFFTVGAKAAINNMTVIAEYISDSRYYLVRANGVATDDSATDTHNAINFTLGYALTGFDMAVKHQSYDVEQGEIKTQGREDLKVNSKIGTFDDNSTRTGLSFSCTHFNNAYVPYFAYQIESGKFAVAGKEETLSHAVMSLGVHGKF